MYYYIDLQSLISSLFRLVLGTVFFVSSVAKVRAPGHFAYTINSFKLIPKTWAKPAGQIIMVIEAVAAFFLLLGLKSRVIAALSIMLLAIFILVISFNLVHGRRNLECGCFGANHKQRIGVRLIVQDLLLITIALYLLLFGGGFLSLDNHLSSIQGKLLEQLVLPLLLLSLEVIILTQLIRQFYRLILIGFRED